MSDERWEPPNMKSVQQLEGNPLVKCGCGRVVNADMMRVMDGGGYGCDSCHETLFRKDLLTREEFAQAHGAPEEVVAMAQHLDALQMDRAFEVALRASPKT